MALLQKGMGGGVTVIFESIGQFCGGFAIAFYRSWGTTLVIMGCTPLLIASTFFLSYTQRTASKRIEDAYAAAGGIASETLSAVRALAAEPRTQRPRVR
jgi:ATP-binding cassette subfamily B (MDR/TAP) protein 1